MSIPKLTECWYANSRVGGSVLNTLSGEPLYITEVMDGFKTYVQDFLGNDSKEIHFEELDMRTPTLGYVNNANGCYYWTRKPTRHYKYGINEKNTCALYNNSNLARNISLRTSNNLNTLENRYPDYLFCAEKVLSGQFKSKAFSRDFSMGFLDDELCLFYRTILIGNLKINTDTDDMKIELHKEFNYLSNLLEGDYYGK